MSFLQKHKKSHEVDEHKAAGGVVKLKSDEVRSSNAKVTQNVANEVNQYECKNEFYENSTQSDEDSKVYFEVCEEGEEYILS